MSSIMTPIPGATIEAIFRDMQWEKQGMENDLRKDFVALGSTP